MLYGIGIDLLELSSMEHSLQNPRFLTRVFSAAEIKMFQAKGMRVETIAANFCAKEAFSKALGTGIRSFRLTEVEILRDLLGKPYYNFSGSAKTMVEELGLSFQLSLTHTGTTAAAFAVAIRE